MFLFVLSASAADVLPVTRVRFYETGVAWFEREGRVEDSTSLPVPTSHLDDALKTLVVLGGDVDLGAISFPSAMGDDAARSNAGLETTVAFQDTLKSLLGVEVSFETGAETLVGMLLEVEGPLTRETAETGRLMVPHYALTLLDERGALHRRTTEDLVSLGAVNAEVSDRLESAVQTLARTRAQRGSALDLQMKRGGRLGLGYLAEAPVWRVSYRVLDPEDGEAQLQAWALVHNDTNEAWDGVQVELANGEPDSFLYPLAAPRYAERELRTPNRDLNTVSQLALNRPDELWNEQARGASGMGVGGLGARGSGYGGGSGTGYGVGGVSMGAASLKTAEPVETPTQFVYQVGRPVNLPAHHSALVPVVQQGVPSEAAVVFAPNSSQGRSGVWLSNGTSSTLPGGILSVVQSGGLAGESRLERLKPGETQMVTFGNELDVEIGRSTEATDPELRSLDYDGNQLRLEQRVSTAHSFEIRNRSGRDRAVWVALELAPTDEVLGETRHEIDRQSGWTWLVLDAEAGTADQVALTERVDARRMIPDAVTVEQWAEWARLELADPEVLRGAAEVRRKRNQIDADLQGLATKTQAATRQLEGLRKTLQVSDNATVARKAGGLEGELRRLGVRKTELERERMDLGAKLREVLEPLQIATSDADQGLSK